MLINFINNIKKLFLTMLIEYEYDFEKYKKKGKLSKINIFYSGIWWCPQLDSNQ